MRRTGLLAVLALSLMLAPLPGEAQQAGRVYRIGVLTDGSDPASKPFLDELRKFGWVEGQNLKIERRLADGQDKLPVHAAELVQFKADLILTIGTPATRAAKEATKTIPIVFSLGADPVANGLVASFARPGGNITGWALGLYNEKLLHVLKEAIPRVSRVAYLASPRGSSQEELNAVARALGIEVQGIVVKGPEDLDSFFVAAKRITASAVLVPNVAWLSPHLDRIAAAAVKSRLPAIGYDRKFADSGGLLSFGPERFQSAPRLAAQVDRILRGAKPADLPVEQPTKFELVVNLKTARALGLSIPSTVILQADKVIE
jgi:ABC-type uncharacterized transport system substrate-binding protein